MNEMISTNEMIERVAKAFWLHMTFGGNSAPFEQQPKQIIDHYRKAARAAIEAMREPTDEMINKKDHPFTYDAIKEYWIECIDAALKDCPKPSDINTPDPYVP